MEIRITEPLGLTWRNELVCEKVGLDGTCVCEDRGALRDDSGQVVPFQWIRSRRDNDGRMQSAELLFPCDLNPHQSRSYWFDPDEASPPFSPDVSFSENANSLTISNSRISLKVPRSRSFGPAGEIAEACPAPIQGICGPDGRFRCASRFVSSVAALNRKGLLVEDQQLRAEFVVRGVVEREMQPEKDLGHLLELRSRVVENGPLIHDHELVYVFDGGSYKVRVRVGCGRPYAVITEESDLTGGALLLSLHEGLEPSFGVANYLGGLNSYVLGRTDTLRFDTCRHLGTIPSHNLENFRECWYAAYRDDPACSDLVGVFRVDGGFWSRGARIGIYEDVAPDLILRCDLSTGRRRWALFSIDRLIPADLTELEDAFADWPYVFDLLPAGGENVGGARFDRDHEWKLASRPHLVIQRMRAREDESSLDELRSWCLDWDDIPADRRPVLWDKERLLLRARGMDADPQDHTAAGDTPMSRKLLWSDYFTLSQMCVKAYAEHNPVEARRVILYLLDYARKVVHQFHVLGGNSPTGLGAYNIGNQLKWMCYLYDVAAPIAALDASVDLDLRAHLAYLAYKLSDTDYFPYDRPEGTTNWNASRCKALAVFGLAFPQHPRSEFFVSHGIEGFQEELQRGVFESGAYIESTGYQQAMMDIPFAYLIRDKAGFDPFRNERFRAMFRYFIDLQTPRCPHFGRRTLPAIGDVTWDQQRPFSVLQAAAPGFAGIDDILAGEMMWTARNGVSEGELGTCSGSVLESLTIPNTHIGESAPCLESKDIPGFGAVLRADVGSADETYLVLKCGEGWGHYHSDENAFTLFALGVPLALDAGKSLYGTAQHREMTSVRAHNTACINCMEQTGLRGRVVHFSSTPPADYVVGDAGVAAGARLYRRHMLFVKNLYIVILDEVSDEDVCEFLLHVLAEDVLTEDSHTHFCGRYGVDLDVYFQASSTLAVHTGESPVHGYGKQKSVSVQGRGSLLTVLIPSKAPHSEADVRLSHGEAHVRFGCREDVVTLTPHSAGLTVCTRGAAQVVPLR